MPWLDEAADRGSFPLDHDGPSTALCSLRRTPDRVSGECKRFMTDFLACLKTSRGDNKPCRIHSKRYLACRMDRCAGGILRGALELIGDRVTGV